MTSLVREIEPRFAPVCVLKGRGRDGSIVLTNALKPVLAATTMPDRLRHWAEHRPDKVFLSELGGEGRRAVTYESAWASVCDLAAMLLGQGLSAERPLAIVAANSIDHALFMLAATSVGVPVAVISPAYAAATAAPYGKFHDVVDMVQPGLLLADDPAGVGLALSGARHLPPIKALHDPDWVSTAPRVDAVTLSGRQFAVGPDTIAKLLMTSGSTGAPKPVINTQRMMVSNMQGLEVVWPFLTREPPVLVDWLPWNHTFGGNCCFNLALYFGGTLHIDAGKPMPKLVGQTIQVLRQIKPSIYFNVPAGYEALLPTLEGDRAFAAAFFGALTFLFNSGAGLPASTRQRLEAASMAAIGRVPPIVGAWGATETAPFSTVIYFPTEHASNLGVPLPGVEIKMVDSSGRTELRVRGPNVFPGYWRQPEATAAAFDDEGYYRIGDAGRLADAGAPEKGILFDGRVGENFKLSSGTWVNVGGVRLAAIAACKPLVSDVVVAGEGRDHLALLVFLNHQACRDFLAERDPALADDPAWWAHDHVVEHVRQGLSRHNGDHPNSSTRIHRFLILAGPPSAQHDEITEKGYINQRRVLSRRAVDAARALEAGVEVGA